MILSSIPAIPTRIECLGELAYNLWWSWHPEAPALFKLIDPELWANANHNPVQLLRGAQPEKLAALVQDPTYLALYDRVLADFDTYMQAQDTWFHQTWKGGGETEKKLPGSPAQAESLIAYFSAEFGLHEALPIYSGGLGVLSGDHCKEASDLGLPFIGVGFLYPQGYFTQHITPDGVQEAVYEKLDLNHLPAVPAIGADGQPVVIKVELGGREVYAKVWQIRAGRITLYLMDTDVDPNDPRDRELSARLYGGDQEMRISQEIILGIGGVRAVRALGLQPTVWHLNEGHAAFLGLERVRELVEEHGLTFLEAREVVAANSVFTTHTPVPAGNDEFPLWLIDKYFSQYWPRLGLVREEFIDLARQTRAWGPLFSMTMLAMRLAVQYNGVSELHGRVSRRLWRNLWPDVPVNELPITSVTNGVHTRTWLAPELGHLFDQYLGPDWETRLDDPATWHGVDAIPDERLWDVKCRLKHKLIDYTRERVRREWSRGVLQSEQAIAAGALLDPEALTIGFARRFATYKRATLLFRDVPRFLRLLNQPGRPVQIIFAGKAHPADEPGKSFIRQVYRAAREQSFTGRVVFLEDYDIDMARHLVAGVDVWLNNPRRPLEASGTSGEKASLNGVPNVSVLDGWWREAYNGENGWAIGDEQEWADREAQDAADAESLYAILENEVVPLFYNRDGAGIPRAWLTKVRQAIKTIAPVFSTRRMVKEYVNHLYIPGEIHGQKLAAEGYAEAKRLAAWKHATLLAWPQVQVQLQTPLDGQVKPGQIHEVAVQVHLGDIDPAEVAVELVNGHTQEAQFESTGVQPLQKAEQIGTGVYIYRGRFVPAEETPIKYRVRVRPAHPELLNAQELGILRWA